MSDQVNGLAQSTNEANYALALVQMGYEIDQQVPIGVRGARGSQVIDIVIYNLPPQKVAVFIQGAYWHKNDLEDDIKQAEATRQGYWVVEVMEGDTETIEACRAHITRTFGGRA